MVKMYFDAIAIVAIMKNINHSLGRESGPIMEARIRPVMIEDSAFGFAFKSFDISVFITQHKRGNKSDCRKISSGLYGKILNALRKIETPRRTLKK